MSEIATYVPILCPRCQERMDVSSVQYWTESRTPTVSQLAEAGWNT